VLVACAGYLALLTTTLTQILPIAWVGSKSLGWRASDSGLVPLTAQAVQEAAVSLLSCISDCK